MLWPVTESSVLIDCKIKFKLYLNSDLATTHALQFVYMIPVLDLSSGVPSPHSQFPYFSFKNRPQRSSQCLDWQPSQFINIVGKDDVAGSGHAHWVSSHLWDGISQKSWTVCFRIEKNPLLIIKYFPLLMVLHENAAKSDQSIYILLVKNCPLNLYGKTTF